MFATLLSGLPRPDDPGDAVAAAIRAQEEAGLEPVTDGRLGDPGFERLAASLGVGGGTAPMAVRAWRHASSITDRAVKQALPGPYSLGRRAAGGAAGVSGGGAVAGAGADGGRGGRGDGAGARARRTLAFADALRREVEALAEAGCPLIEIEETEAHLIGEDEAERALFGEAHRRLVEGMQGTHLSLSIVGASAAEAGIETIFAAPYASLAVDLVDGPDNWTLVTRLRGDRGVVAGVLGASERGDHPTELLLWAAHYAASTGRRGMARVGLGSAGSWANLTWEAAVIRMQRLGEAARLASLPPSDELLRSLRPEAVSARRAALGHDAPPRPRRERPRRR